MIDLRIAGYLVEETNTCIVYAPRALFQERPVLFSGRDPLTNLGTSSLQSRFRSTTLKVGILQPELWGLLHRHSHACDVSCARRGQPVSQDYAVADIGGCIWAYPVPQGAG